MLSDIKLNVLSVIMLNVVLLCVLMLSDIMLRVIMQNVIMLYTECHYDLCSSTMCHYAERHVATPTTLRPCLPEPEMNLQKSDPARSPETSFWSISSLTSSIESPSICRRNPLKLFFL